MSKYIDLATKIHEQTRYATVKPALILIRRVLQWLDNHPDQVPGRTITESEWNEACKLSMGGNMTAPRRLAARLGITIIPDPEPTNAAKATADLEAWGISRGSALELGAWLAGQGWMRTPDHD